MTMTAIPRTRKVVHYDLPAGLSDKIVETRSWRNRSKELVECFKKSCVCMGEKKVLLGFIHSFVCAYMSILLNVVEKEFFLIFRGQIYIYIYLFILHTRIMLFMYFKINPCVILGF